MLHYNPRHVSSINMSIFRRTNCIITASGIVTLCKRLYSMPDARILPITVFMAGYRLKLTFTFATLRLCQASYVSRNTNIRGKSLTDTTGYPTLRKSSSIDCHYNKNTLFQRWRLYSKPADQPKYRTRCHRPL